MSRNLSGGLDNKYIISKRSGNLVDPKADYFVLRLDKDPNAIKAISAYAVSVMNDNPDLAFDLFKKAERYLNKLPNHDLTLLRNASLIKENNRFLKRIVEMQLKINKGAKP